MNKYGLKCPKDGSTEIWRIGLVPTLAGRKARYKCTMCAHSFYEDAPGAKVVIRVRKPKVVAKRVKEVATVASEEEQK